MPFEKGTSGNPQGRPKGSRNRTGEDLRELFKTFCFEQFPAMVERFEKLDATQQWRFFNELARHVVGPPISLDRLTEQQLEELYSQVKIKFAQDDEDKDITEN